MKCRRLACAARGALALCLVLLLVPLARAEGDWEITPESEKALARGLQWLAENQTGGGNWESNDLGLVSTGMLAFAASGHLPGRGQYGDNVQRALNYILRNADAPAKSRRNPNRPADQIVGLLNIAEARRGMYNHGLSTFALGQMYGMTGDPKVEKVLERALYVIQQTQCKDGGWDYIAKSQEQGHDLSLAVMQSLALRSAMDSGLDVQEDRVRLAIQSVREHFTRQDGRRASTDQEREEEDRLQPDGRFTYTRGGGNATTAMAAAGVVCLQEFGQYDDWRIQKNIKIILEEINKLNVESLKQGKRAPFDAYTLWYVAQALYQVGGDTWKTGYPKLRDAVVASQMENGMWSAQGQVGGRPGELYQTAVCCFVLAIPNRYLPILQEGRIDTLQEKFGKDKKK